MDFKDTVKQLAERIATLKEQIKTEEATKNALIMPFISMLGYDVFNPLEVVPEMDCDISKKKGEKIDYAIMRDGEPIILFECKHWEQPLDSHTVQLRRYYVASKAKFAVLTNGISYRFYTDIEKANIMDEAPFLEFSIDTIRDTQIEELKKFHKSYFDVDNIMGSASELKYMSQLKSVIKEEFSSPSSDFVRLLTKRIYEGQVNAKVLEQFTTLVKRSLSSYVNDVLTARLNMAMPEESAPALVQEPSPVNNAEETISEEPRIVTTQEELEGYYIVKSILRDTLPSERVTYRDAISYFCIFADDNNRKLICRLCFNKSEHKKIEFQNDDKTCERFPIDTLDDIYKYTDKLIESAKRYITLS